MPVSRSIKADQLLGREIGQQERACDKASGKPAPGEEIAIAGFGLPARFAPADDSHRAHHCDAADEGKGQGKG